MPVQVEPGEDKETQGKLGWEKDYGISFTYDTSSDRSQSSPLHLSKGNSLDGWNFYFIINSFIPKASKQASTFWSILESHRSLMIQPAPRMMTEPAPKRAIIFTDSTNNDPSKPTAELWWWWKAAIPILQAHGQNSKRLPTGFSNLTSSR